MKWYQIDEDKKRAERRHRRKVINDWKAEAKAVRDADPSKKMLLREAKLLSLARVEEAARTQAQFEDILIKWDNIKIVEDWRLAKHELLNTDSKSNNNYSDDHEETEYEQKLAEHQTVIPKPLDHVYWRQLLGGNSHDVIFDCPHELDEITTSRPVRDFMLELDESHKEILYYRAIRYWKAPKIATLRGQSERNIRKVYNNMIADIRKKLYIRLFGSYMYREPLTHAQREFMETYWQQLDEAQQGKIVKKIAKEEERRIKDAKKASKEEIRFLNERVDDE